MEKRNYDINRLSNTINSIVIVCSFIVSILCMIYSFGSDAELRPMLLLPIIYCVCAILLVIGASRTKNNLFHSLVLAFYVVQYLFIPLLILKSGSYNWSNYNSAIHQHIFDAVFLQSLVLLCVTFYLITARKQMPQMEEWTTTSEYIFSRKAKVLIIAIIVISAALLIRYPQLLLKFRLIVYSENTSYLSYLASSETVKRSMPLLVYELGLWLIKITKLVIVYYLILIIWKRFHQRNVFLGVLVSTIVISSSCIITTEDKACAIFSALACFLLMARLYDKYTVTIIKVCGLLIGILILGVFIVFPLVYNANTDLGYRLNAYFSGTINVAGGFLMAGGNKIYTFLGDIFRSLPLLNHFFVKMPMSYLEFNTALGYETVYNSEILPIISQGFYYFNIVGAVAYPILQLNFSKKMFNHMLASKGSFEFYTFSMLFIFSFLGLYLYDMALTFSQILNYCLPIFAVYFISKRRGL